jgi:chemotaxis protein methyltransferase CheR
METLSTHLTEKQFNEICELAYSLCGIKLTAGKEELVKSRLMKRIRALKLLGFDEYIAYVHSDTTGTEIRFMLDELATNKTSFFREMPHFDYMISSILPHLQNRKIRIWSAGCSSGEEPYTIAMVLREYIADVDRKDVAILATDLSHKILARAREGVYEKDTVKEVPAGLVPKYFTHVNPGPSMRYRANDNIRKLIRFAHLNLMGDWPMKGPFDLIFCRNVMIYFDKPTQNTLINRYYDLLCDGGVLFVGHSESFTGLKHRFRFIKPAIYMK